MADRKRKGNQDDVERKRKTTRVAGVSKRKGARCDTYEARWRDENGKSCSKAFRRETEANDFLAQVKADLRSGTYVSPTDGRESWRAVADAWLAVKARQRKAR